MVEAVMIWNEPNNKSHWDLELDPEWLIFSEMARLAGQAIKAENPRLARVLGGISPIDPFFITRLEEQGGLDEIDIIGVHGFPLDWNHWQLNDWPSKIEEIEAVTDKPVWVTEVGVSSFGAQEVQAFGLKKTYELLKGRVDRVHWYSLFDLPKAWPATTRHREAEGSSYYRHFYMGLIDENMQPKLSLQEFNECTPEFGVCQWFHFQDHRLEEGVKWLKKLGVRKLRTGLSWSDSYQPGWEDWFDKQMSALEDFDLTVTFCFTPESCGVVPHYASPPKYPEEFAEFCGRMVRRYKMGDYTIQTESKPSEVAPAAS